MTSQKYESDIVLGGKYRDKQTGFEGVAIYVTFHQHSCERVALEGVAEGGDIKAFEFDAVRLSATGPVPAFSPVKTGGNGVPVRSTGRRG